MSIASIEAEIKKYVHAALDKARSIGHHSTTDLEHVAAKLKGDGKQLADEATTDLHQVVEAAKPAMQQAQDDGKQLAGEVVTDIKAAAQPTVSPEPPAAA
jgi:hypothetical protein